VKSHELPDDSKDEFFVSILDVLGTNADLLNFELRGGVESNLAVDSFLEGVVRLLLDAVPLHNLIVDLVDGLA